MLLYCKFKKYLLNWFVFKPVQASYYFEDENFTESLEISIQTEQFSINYLQQSDKIIFDESFQNHLTIPLKTQRTYELKKNIILKQSQITWTKNYDVEAFELNCDGNIVAAVYIQPYKIDTKLLIIHSHSNNPDIGCCMQEYLKYCQKFKVCLLGYDYPGYGLSSGEPNEESIYKTITCVYDFALTLGFPSSQIVAFGQSLGTSPSLYLASQVRIAGLILRSSFISILNTISKMNQTNSNDLFKNYDLIQKVDVPLLLIHGEQDELVHFQQAQELFEFCQTEKSQKQLVILKDASHNNLGTCEDQYYEAIASFLEILNRRN